MSDEDKDRVVKALLWDYPGGLNEYIPNRTWLTNPKNLENLSPLRPYVNNKPAVPDRFPLPLILAWPRPDIFEKVGDNVVDPFWEVRLRFGIGCYEGDASDLNWYFWEFWRERSHEFLSIAYPSREPQQLDLLDELIADDDEEEDIEEEDPMSELEFFSFLREDRFLFANLQKKIREYIGGSKLSGQSVHQFGIVLNILERFPISESWYSATIGTPDQGNGTNSISIEGDTIRFSRTYINQSEYGSDSESTDFYEVGVGCREVDDYSEVRDFIAEVFSEQTLEIYADDPPNWEFEPVVDAWSYAINKTVDDGLEE